MKIQAVLLASLTSVLVACGGNSNEQSNNQVSNQTSTAEVKEAVAKPAGKQLISKSDCMGCHTEKTKILGPSYLEIAAKYPATEENIKHLTKVIIEGGNGVWGDVPMTAHPQISQADAQEMVNYILSVK